MIEHKPPGISKDGRTADISTDNHIPEEKPFANKGLAAISWRHTHDRVICWIETQSSCRQTISDEVDPEKLNRN